MEERWTKPRKKRHHHHVSLAPSWQWHHHALHGDAPCAFRPSSRGIPRGCRCRQQPAAHRPCATRRCLLRRLQNLRPSSVVPRWPRAVVAQRSMRGGLETSLNPSPIRCQIRRLVRRHSNVTLPKKQCFFLQRLSPIKIRCSKYDGREAPLRKSLTLGFTAVWMDSLRDTSWGVGGAAGCAILRLL